MKKNNARFQNCGLIDSMNEPVTTDQLWPIEWSSGILPVSALWLWYLFDINKSHAPCGLPVARMHMANQGKSHMFILFASFCTYPGVAVGCQETLYLCSRCPTQMYPQMSWKGWENPSSFLYGFQCAPFFDRQKLIWRTLGAFRTNFWGEKWENQKQSRWVGCKQIQIRRCAKPIINSCNHDHNLLWCPKAVPMFHHWDWMDWGMFFWTSPKHTQTVFLNCMKYYQFSESLAMLFSEAVIAVQLRNSMFPLALRWPALRPPQQLLRDTNGKTVFFSGCSCRDRGWVGSASMTLKTATGGAVKKKNSKILLNTTKKGGY